MKNLVIVESPAKAKTIEKFLGADFKVVSCKGHIRDLVDGNAAIDIDNNFQPHYEVPPEKEMLVKELKKLVKQAEIIWLATDEDREGEAISWHLFEVLKLNKENTKRIVFNEITKPAIQKAVSNPRDIDNFLVDAQQARRILDRLVGYGLSPVLWKQVRPKLSAGRVQSVAVRLVVEREREIIDFHEKSEYKIIAIFNTSKGKSLKAELPKRYKTEEEALKFIESLVQAKFNVTNIEVKPTYRNPSPPFTTSTLQQEASRKLGYDVTRTMQLAQKLYENGHISYMRTDSVNLSQTAIEGAKNEILSAYGQPFLHSRNFATKSENAQEAHEAIRPTYFNVHEAGSTPQEKRLYDLIWKRSIASQMSKAELEKTIISIANSNNQEILRAEGEVMKFEGFLKVYFESTDDDLETEEMEGILPAVSVGEQLLPISLVGEERYSKHAPRYSEASLVKKLEELGIGRPSTYAPTIQTIQKRGYIITETRPAFQRTVKRIWLKENQISQTIENENFGAEKNKLFPSDIGMLVTDFLAQNFKDIMDYGFTAAVEKEFDEIAKGLKSWQNMLDEFYKPFQISVENTTKTGERVNGERILGKDPISGLTVLVRMGQYGPMVQLGARDETETPKYASLLSTQRMETVELGDAIKMLSIMNNGFVYNDLPVTVGNGSYGPYIKYNDKYINLTAEINILELNQEKMEALLADVLSKPSYPLNLGDFEGTNLQVNSGRFGPYVKHKNLFVSIPKSEDPFTLTYERAMALVLKKREDELKKLLRTFDGYEDITIQQGRYGPFIKYGKENLRIPKDKEVETITIQEILELAKTIAPKSTAKGKKAPAKTTTAKKKTAAKK